MNKYIQQAGKHAFACALMNSNETFENTCLVHWFLDVTENDPTFVLEIEDDKPALFLFLKYHKAHPSGTIKNNIFQLLKDRTPPDTIYMGRSMTDWQSYFEEFLGAISPF